MMQVKKRTMLTLPLAAALAAPASAQADKADCTEPLERTYSKAYRQVAKKHGTRAPGRNIRKYGVLFRKVVFDATCSELRRSRGQLRKLMRAPAYAYPRAVPPAQPPAGVKTRAIESVGGTSNGMVNPYCESSGNPQVVDPSGTYWGWYQFDFQTWVAHGGAPGAYGNAPLYVQHQVAARVQYDAWPNC
jgi:hypothetical protein